MALDLHQQPGCDGSACPTELSDASLRALALHEAQSQARMDADDACVAAFRAGAATSSPR